MSTPLDIDALYRTHGPAVLRRARAILGSEADAREVLQDVFASLVARPEQFLGTSSAMTFLYRMTTHRCLNLLRNSRNRMRLLDTNAPVGTDAGAAGPEARTVVADLLRSLPDELAQVVVHHHIDGMSHAEIAAILGCSRRHVGNLLARVKREHALELEPSRC